LDPAGLSTEGRAVYRLLTAADRESAESALDQLPAGFQERLAAMSPLARAREIHAPLIHVMHDRYDPVIPVGESRRLVAALSGRPGVRYTELRFRHLDPTTLSPMRLVRELPRAYGAMFPIFRCAMG
ncbi:MAG TPA: hypothetical protein VFX49_16295, partial [Chloroflexota bacterium]|nr:hypothetical protein [Chloroflexota bacterium]